MENKKGRKLNKLPLAKTDKEVFSRVIKKKLIAISNDMLFQAAKVVINGF
jgi:hypothetical protein